MQDVYAAWVAAVIIALVAITAYLAYRQLRLIEQMNRMLLRSPRLVARFGGEANSAERALLEPYVSANLSIHCTFDLWLHNHGDRSDRDIVLRLWIPHAYRVVEHWGGGELQKDGSQPDSVALVYRIPFNGVVRPGLPELVGRYNFTDMPSLDPLRIEWDVVSAFGSHPSAGRGMLDVEFAPPQS